MIKRLITKIQREIWLRRGDRRGLIVDAPDDAPTPSRKMQPAYWIPVALGTVRGRYALHDTISWIVDQRWENATVLRPTVRHVCQPSAGSDVAIGVAIVGSCAGCAAADDGRIPLRATAAEVTVWRVEHLFDDRDALRAAATRLAADLARQTDDLIVQSLSQTRTVIQAARGGMTNDKVLAARDMLRANIGCDDGDVFAVVGRHQWRELCANQEFDHAQPVSCGPDYIASERAKLWQGIRWLVYDHLPIVDGMRTCFVYHIRAVGHAIAEGFVTQIAPGEGGAHIVRCTLRQGARLLDERCVVAVPCVEEDVS